MRLAAAGTFGSIRLEGNNWRIACEPHVRARLRRVFAQASKRASDVLSISNTPENCRELLWFLERFPMEVSGLRQMRASAAAHVATEARVQQLLSRVATPEDFELAEPARQYQREAASLAAVRGGLLVADDVGLGKTVTGTCPMTRARFLPALVVTLTHLTGQWESMINRFAPHLKTHVLKTGQPYELAPPPRRRAKAQGALFEEAPPREPDVLITNYAKLSGWSERLAGRVNYVCFDEVQELRRNESNRYAAAKHIAQHALLRVGLSATPIYNYGSEWFNIIDILLPGALGTAEEFRREWCIDDDRIGDTQAFGTHLYRSGLMLRRTRRDVGRELPPCDLVPHTIASDRAALDHIKGAAVELARVILATQAHRGQKFLASEEFNSMMRQATGIAKAPHVADFVRMLMASNERVVLYGWHREVYRIWLERLAEFNPVLYTGSESPAQKQAAKQAFIEGRSRILIISLRAGAGLDGLQHVCNVGVFGELDWSPGVHEQCVGRFHRDEQARQSTAFFLLSEDGSDPVIADVLGIKRGQSEGVRDPNGQLVEQLSVERGGIQRMAQEFLQQQGITLGQPSAVQSDNAADEQREELPA